jgi:organic hydroperoxide reductase OsmC/OhrA
MSEPAEFRVSMDQVNDFYEFVVRFDKEQYSPLRTDEPSPHGGDRAPNPSRLLAAAVGNCLSASLVFCAKKSRIALQGMHTEVQVEYGRTETGKLRIAKMEVEISPKYAAEDAAKVERCRQLFEDFCVVTQSVRAGIPVCVTVRGSE